MDTDSFTEWDADIASSDFLEFPGYAGKLEAARKKSGEVDAVITGSARIEGMPCAVFSMSPEFMMGSMGAAVGEKVTRCFERACTEGLPVVGFTISGGARMQEGTTSLMQMAKCSAAVERFSRAGGLYITVLCDPTSGGVTASFAMEGDIILAEPGALVAFAGPRVIEQTIHKRLPAGFQRAEFQLEHGFVDAIVDRRRMRDTLGFLLYLHAPQSTQGNWSGREHDGSLRVAPSSSVPLGASVADVQEAAATAASVAAEKVAAAGRAAAAMAAGVATAAKDKVIQVAQRPATETPTSIDEPHHASTQDASTQSTSDAYARVQHARSTERASALAVLTSVFDGFIELHGDRLYADDAAVVGGLAILGGTPVTIIATERGSSLEERVQRNFGSAHPEGYRKALRLMRQAEKFKRPVICLVDTSGAYCGIEAEERGQGEAIARNLMAMSTLATPIVSIIIGEGGSGGALGLAVADEVWMLENAVYSVISPEGCASILYKDAKRAPDAAEALGITANKLYELGIIDVVIAEGDGSTSAIAASLAPELNRVITELVSVPTEDLLERRYTKFRKMGVDTLC